MKKEYIQPQVKAYTIKNSAILITASDGTTGEQNAKNNYFDNEEW